MHADMQVHACHFVVVCVCTSLCVRILHACVERTIKWYTLVVGPNTQFALYQLAVSFEGGIIRVCSTGRVGCSN